MFGEQNEKNIGKISSDMLPKWSLASTIGYRRRGRIWLIWYPGSLNAAIVEVSGQFLYVYEQYDPGKCFYCTVIYGSEDDKGREKQ